MVKQKSVFWQALILTIIVFLLGVALGYFLETGRIDEIKEEYAKLETEWADSRLANIYYQNLDPKYCDYAIQQNLIFGDKIYQQGLKIDKYEKAAPFTEKNIQLERKRYGLFKTEFLFNSLALKERCNANYDILIYFFAANPTVEEQSAQGVQSRILEQLKEEKGSNLMLIPLPTDLDISVIKLFIESQNITSTPAILINEKIKLEGVRSIEDISNAIKKNP